MNAVLQGLLLAFAFVGLGAVTDRIEAKFSPEAGPRVSEIAGTAVGTFVAQDCGSQQWIRQRADTGPWVHTCVDADLSRRM